MIVIISPERSVADEITYVNLFFEHGLDFFHVRKYKFSDDEMRIYLRGIAEKFRPQLVLHSHHHLAQDFDIARLHFREEHRLEHTYSDQSNHILSTSVHGIEDFNTLGDIWQYAFLSPVFPSISKAGYGDHHTVINDLKKKTNPHVKLIGLGGIHAQNYQRVLENGADGIALLGSIWQSSDPLDSFLQCKKIIL